MKVTVLMRIIDTRPGMSSTAYTRDVEYAIVPAIGDEIEILPRRYENGEETNSAAHLTVSRRYLHLDVKGDELPVEVHVDVRVHNIAAQWIGDLMRNGWREI